MSERQCCALEEVFDDKTSRREIRRYHRKGPRRMTRELLRMVREAGFRDGSLLDIGGGIGTIQHELVASGARRVINVDASPSYLQAARIEAERRGYADRAEYHEGDFVAIAPRIRPVDLVTLDRVICCYDDMPALVGFSAERSKRLYALVYPRDPAWIRGLKWTHNAIRALFRSPFRAYIHRTRDVEDLLQKKGFRRRGRVANWWWQTVLYERTAA